MKNFREHVNDCKKEHRKKGKLAKKQAIKPSGKKAATAPLPPTAETHPLLGKLKQALTLMSIAEKCLDESCRAVPKPAVGDLGLAELWQIYFYQCETGGARVSCATDWGLPDFRLTLEGTEIMGYVVCMR